MNEIEIVVSSKNKTNLDELGKDAKKAGSDVETGLRKGFKGAEDAAEKSTKNIENTLERTGDAAGRAGVDVGSKFSAALDTTISGGTNPIEGIFDAAKGMGGVAAAAASIGGVFVTGLAQTFEQTKIGGMIAAQTGAATDAAGKLGNVVGDVFAGNFGDSLEEVGQALTDVIQTKLVDSTATEAELKRVTELAITASKVVGEETKQIGRAARQLMINGLAGSVEEAMDLIVHASQEGLNVNDDLIDTIVEYGTKFRDLGISGPEALGLISQAMNAGARDTDYAADALKEFSIRAQDMSPTTVRGFEAIGLNAKAMGDAIGAGGDKAHGALRLTLDGLRSIHDPMLRNQAAVDLFGTKAEDLGDALFNMDLDTAAAQFGEFADAADQAAKKMADSTPAVENFMRNLSQKPKDALEWATKDKDLDAAVGRWKEYNKAQEDAAVGSDAYKERVEAAADAQRRSSEAIAENTATLAENIEMASKSADTTLDLWDAQTKYAEQLQSAKDSLKENGATLDANSEKGRNNRDALSDLAKATYDQIEAMEQQGHTSAQVQAVVAAQRDEFVRLADKMGLSAAEANNLADRLGLIPGNYVASVYVNNSQANGAIQNTAWMLSQLRDKTVTLTVHQAATYAREAKYGGFAHGGVVGTAASGGPRSNLTWVGEQGPELVDLAPGTMVHSNADSQRITREMAGPGGLGPTQLTININGDPDNWLAAVLKKMDRDGLISLAVN